MEEQPQSYSRIFSTSRLTRVIISMGALKFTKPSCIRITKLIMTITRSTFSQLRNLKLRYHPQVL